MTNHNKILLEMIEQEISDREEGRVEENDHEGRMARGELRDMIKNAISLYKKLNDNDELPGWVSSYISLATDYIHTVSQYLAEDEQVNNREEENEM
jgi:hypothetical protein